MLVAVCSRSDGWITLPGSQIEFHGERVSGLRLLTELIHLPIHVHLNHINKVSWVGVGMSYLQTNLPRRALANVVNLQDSGYVRTDRSSRA
jgi:hypothetical protein